MPDARKWTFVVHHNADFFFDIVHAHLLGELASVGSTDEVALLVLRDGFEREPGGLYHLVRGQEPAPHPAWPAGELDMSDPAVLARLMRFARDLLPAERYALVVAGHGYGWTEGWYRSQRRIYPRVLIDRWRAAWPPEAGLGRTLGRAGIFAGGVGEEAFTRCLSPDMGSGREMTAAGLRRGLEQVRDDLGRPLDLLAFDACSMQMAEIAFQLAGQVLHQVGPEWYGLGWPYAAIATALTAGPEMDARTLAERMVDLYRRRRVAEGDSVFTLSALDLTRREDLRTGIDALARALLAPGVPLDTVRAVAHDTVLVEEGYAYRDLGDFALRLDTPALPDPVRQAARDLQTALRGLVTSRCAGGSADWPLGRTTGLSIFLPLTRTPLDPDGETYRGLAMSGQTAWRRFLLALAPP